MRWAVPAVVLACAACSAWPGADRQVRLLRLEADQRALLAQLDDLQARLLVDAERVRFWEELRTRHENVSAIACTSQEAQAVAMVENLQQDQAATIEPARPSHQARVASIRHELELAAQAR